MKKIVVLDFGNQDNENLIKVIRGTSNEGILLDHRTKAKEILEKNNVIGIIISGGYTTSKSNDLEAFDGKILSLGLPTLGLGRGMQVIIHELGGKVTPAGYVYEPTPSKLTFHNTKKGVFKDSEKERTVLLGFDAKVSKLPEGFTVLASGKEVKSGDDRPFGAMENVDKDIYGIQFVTQLNKEAADIQAIKNFIALCEDRAGRDTR